MAVLKIKNANGELEVVTPWGLATQTSAGVMSAEDKKKLDELDVDTNIEYGDTLPTSGEEGEIFLLEETEQLATQTYVDERTSDYIVDYGTTDGWKYRKWNSGVCEAWKTFTNVAFETKVSWGNGYLSSQNGSTHQHWFSLPSGLMTSGDVAHIDLGTPGYVMMACFTDVSSAGVSCYIWSPTSYDGSTPINKVCVTVNGTWK